MSPTQLSVKTSTGSSVAAACAAGAPAGAQMARTRGTARRIGRPYNKRAIAGMNVARSAELCDCWGMRQLTSLDAQFLALENPRQAGHVAGLAILDPSTTATGEFTVDDGEGLLPEPLPQLPPLRWRLAEVPLGLDYPYWVDDV